MSTLKSIAVFSGSSAGNDIRFQEAAAKLGCLIGERKIRFIYGGGGLGLMGIAARHAKERGSYVIGILPELMNTPDVTEGNVESELLVVPDMHERKARMYSLADAFAVLPGGIGTLDEFFEIYTWKQIGYHGKNIALLNTEGYWDPLLEMLDKLLLKMRNEWKVRIEHLEYGPGTAVPYFKGKEAKTYTDEGLDSLREAIGSMQWKGNVTIELGRAFAAECGYYLTEIRDVKKNKDTHYCIVDGGNHQLNYDGQIRGMYHPDIQVIPGDNRGQRKKWTVCGALCTMNDVLCSDVELADVRTGRVLVFERTGAYSAMEGMALFLSHSLPAVVSYDRNTGWSLLRDHQPTYIWNMPDESLKETESSADNILINEAELSAVNF